MQGFANFWALEQAATLGVLRKDYCLHSHATNPCADGRLISLHSIALRELDEEICEPLCWHIWSTSHELAASGDGKRILWEPKAQ